jgi:hypothetical protein
VIVGISGKAQTGKSAVAQRLAERWGFVVVSFADALREEVLARLPATLRALHGYTCPRFEVLPNGNLRHRLCNWGDEEGCIREMVYERKPPGVRELLQEYGSEVRRADEPEYWIEQWAVRAYLTGAMQLVAPDVRFENEARAVLEREGVLWRIERPNHSGILNGSHQSETVMDAWDRWDAIIRNDGTLADLHAKVDALASCLAERVA